MTGVSRDRSNRRTARLRPGPPAATRRTLCRTARCRRPRHDRDQRRRAPRRTRARPRGQPDRGESQTRWRRGLTEHVKWSRSLRTKEAREKLATTNSRALPPKRLCSSGLSSKCATASASACGCSGWYSRPFSRSLTNSNRPPTLLATTGRPVAIASRHATPKLSSRLGMMKISESLNNLMTSDGV